MNTLLEGQPRGGGGANKGAQKPEDIVSAMAEKILHELPE
jgi:hypothetical protein